MRNSIYRLTLAGLLLLNVAGMVFAQAPKAEKDTVNADKAAKPVFYQATEDENTSKEGVSSTVLIIAGVVVVAGVAFFLLKKKK
jgi:LPXTG-motif cell wall-anchored protein